MFDLAGGLTIAATWQEPRSIGGGCLLGKAPCLVRTIKKPLAYITNVLLVKNGIHFEDYNKDV